ncbi:MAG: hypothetical protein IPP72_04275 [Chitinophagaceae bacterium]|nr:hypothetical protein [Chitinophagaceae bacterium]
MVKMDASGSIEWQRSLGGTADETGNAIIQTADSGYLVAASTASTDGDVSNNHGNNNDAWIIKLNSGGIIEWEKSYGGSGSEGANSIIKTSDGGFVFAGYAGSLDGDVSGFHGSIDLWMVKIDQLGDTVWQHCFGGMGSEQAGSVIETADSSYVAVGFSTSNEGDLTSNKGYTDAWIIKVTANGLLAWQKNYGGVDYDYASAVKEIPDGGLIVAGSTKSSLPNAPIGKYIVCRFL